MTLPTPPVVMAAMYAACLEIRCSSRVHTGMAAIEAPATAANIHATALSSPKMYWSSNIL